MTDGFWHRAWQFALLFAVIAMMAATIVVSSGDLSAADVREIMAEQGVPAGQPAYAVDQPIRPELTPTADLAAAPADELHITYAPAVPPPVDRTDQRRWEVSIEAIEGVCPIGPDTSTSVWGFRVGGDEIACGSPGPVLRGRVGDLAVITLTNDASSVNPHNIDFHAVTGQGGGAASLTVNPGESATIEVRLLYPGAFMYHCAYGDVPSHIAHGMVGMFIVDPEAPLPAVDHEWAIMQSEWYVGEPDATGLAAFDHDSLFAEEPRHVTFNGRTDALTGGNSLTMAVGERARIYFVNEGLNLDSNFHPIGSHWDLVYPEAATHAANRVIRGSQSTLVVAGGGTVVELDGLVPSTIILVDHALVRTFYKGAIGLIEVTGAENPEIYRDLVAPSTPPPDTGQADVEVTIPTDAFLPDNAAIAYQPLEITVPVGTTVRWTNSDTVAHTVTSGTSDGAATSADGRFDSGFVDAGDSWSYTFDEPGEYPYFCLPHPWMVGRVIVEG